MLKPSKYKDVLVVAVFFFSIAVITSGMVFGLDFVQQNDENRKLAELPALRFDLQSLQSFPKDFADYFNDHFGFRNTLISMNFLIHYNILHESPSDYVVKGKKGWLFYQADGAIEDYRGITHLDDKTLEQMASFYERKREWLQQKGIRYILVIAPNKESIYGEWMPDYLFKINDKNVADEVIDYLRTHTKVHILDLREILIRHKATGPLYSKTSSIWNEFGAFLAYQEIMKFVSEWFPVVQALPMAEFRREREEIRGDDLAEMIGGAAFLKDEKTVLVPKERRRAIRVFYKRSGSYKYELGMEVERVDYPRLLVFRDCFFTKLIPFLSEHFQYSKYYWESWDPDTNVSSMINTISPNIVIEEKVERYLKFPSSP